MRKSIVLVLTMMVVSGVLVYAQQNQNLVLLTKEDVGEYRGVVEFDLREQPSSTTIFQFELKMQKQVCSINYKPPTASLNGNKLALQLNADEKSFTYRGRAGELLKTQGNRLLLNSGSCKKGDHKLSLVKALTVEAAPATTWQLAQ